MEREKLDRGRRARPWAAYALCAASRWPKRIGLVLGPVAVVAGIVQGDAVLILLALFLSGASFFGLRRVSACPLPPWRTPSH